MRLSIKTTFHVHISNPVVTFPSFGLEGHGVQPPQGDSVCLFVCLFFMFVLKSIDFFSYNFFFPFQPSEV